MPRRRSFDSRKASLRSQRNSLVSPGTHSSISFACGSSASTNADHPTNANRTGMKESRSKPEKPEDEYGLLSPSLPRSRRGSITPRSRRASMNGTRVELQISLAQLRPQLQELDEHAAKRLVEEVRLHLQAKTHTKVDILPTFI